jgi:aspartate racemase
MEAYERADLATVRAHLAASAERLAGAGCDFFACPDNTAHIALETPGPELAIPGLHIAGIVAERAIHEGYRRLGLLGTRWSMEGPVYARACARAGLELLVPPAEDRERVDAVIFDELCQGVIRDASRQQYVRILQDFARQGCDAVALGCTEIPLLVTPGVSPLPTLDSTRLLAQAAVGVALEHRAFPTWRGGPVR